MALPCAEGFVDTARRHSSASDSLMTMRSLADALGGPNTHGLRRRRPDVAEACSGLRRCALKVVQSLASARPQYWGQFAIQFSWPVTLRHRGRRHRRPLDAFAITAETRELSPSSAAGSGTLRAPPGVVIGPCGRGLLVGAFPVRRQEFALTALRQLGNAVGIPRTRARPVGAGGKTGESDRAERARGRVRLRALTVFFGDFRTDSTSDTTRAPTYRPRVASTTVAALRSCAGKAGSPSRCCPSGSRKSACSPRARRIRKHVVLPGVPSPGVRDVTARGIGAPGRADSTIRSHVKHLFATLRDHRHFGNVPAGAPGRPGSAPCCRHRTRPPCYFSTRPTTCGSGRS